MSKLRDKFREVAPSEKPVFHQTELPELARQAADFAGIEGFRVPGHAIDTSGGELAVNITPLLEELDVPFAGSLIGATMKMDEEFLAHSDNIHVVVDGYVNVVGQEGREDIAIENSADVAIQVLKQNPGHKDSLRAEIDYVSDMDVPVPEINEQFSFNGFSLAEDVNSKDLTVTTLLPHEEGAINLGELAANAWEKDSESRGVFNTDVRLTGELERDVLIAMRPTTTVYVPMEMAEEMKKNLEGPYYAEVRGAAAVYNEGVEAGGDMHASHRIDYARIETGTLNRVIMLDPAIPEEIKQTVAPVSNLDIKAEFSQQNIDKVASSAPPKPGEADTREPIKMTLNVKLDVLPGTKEQEPGPEQKGRDIPELPAGVPQHTEPALVAQVDKKTIQQVQAHANLLPGKGIDITGVDDEPTQARLREIFDEETPANEDTLYEIRALAAESAYAQNRTALLAADAQNIAWLSPEAYELQAGLDTVAGIHTDFDGKPGSQTKGNATTFVQENSDILERAIAARDEKVAPQQVASFDQTPRI